ncbi:GMC oxidoreductase [Streptomyces hygroscopicus]|uniref:GMC oxidoreductase n=1 Tax=Streptomyces hygroscopicus TaxID=1912 RepID=UPI003F4CCC3F
MSPGRSLPPGNRHLAPGAPEGCQYSDQAAELGVSCGWCGGRGGRRGVVLVEQSAEYLLAPDRGGGDPAQSVLDPLCRSHDVENLWVTDSSFFRPPRRSIRP